jgi:hypothetical protein
VDLDIVKEEIGSPKSPKRRKIDDKAEKTVKHVAKNDVSVRPSSGIPSGDGEEKPWYDGCEYQCNFCPLACKTRSQISIHIKGYHKKKDLARGEGYVASESSIECKICSVSVSRNLSMIKTHLAQRHKTSLEEYEQKHLPAGSDQATDNQVDNSIDYVPANVAWYDRCSYSCPLCDYTTWWLKDIRNHIKKCSAKKDGAPVKEEVVSSKVFMCKECDLKVLHEHMSIAAHLTKKHGMSLGDYSVKHKPYKSAGASVARVEESSNNWFDGCVYQCMMCTYTAKFRQAMCHHLSSLHKEKAKQGKN